jgi:hypothetical protein
LSCVPALPLAVPRATLWLLRLLRVRQAAALVDFTRGSPTAAAPGGTNCQWLLLKDQNDISAGAEAYFKLVALCVAAHVAGTSRNSVKNTQYF